MMMKPTYLRKRNHIPHFRALNRLGHGAIHIERQMYAVLMIVAQVFCQNSLEMSLIQDYVT